MSHIADTHDELGREWSHFLNSWRSSQSAWTNEVSFQFQKQFVEPMESEIPIFLARLEALETELRAAQRELNR